MEIHLFWLGSVGLLGGAAGHGGRARPSRARRGFQLAQRQSVKAPVHSLVLIVYLEVHIHSFINDMYKTDKVRYGV